MPAQNNSDNDTTDTSSKSGDFAYYKTNLSGLEIHLEQPEERGQTTIEKAKFTAVQLKDERNGEKYSVGVLKTDDEDVKALAEEDSNVTTITKKQYDDIVSVDSES
jgi:hypothetical protein